MHFIHRIHWHVHLLTRGRRDKKTSSRTNVHGESAHSIIDSSARTKYTTGATNEEEVAMEMSILDRHAHQNCVRVQMREYIHKCIDMDIVEMQDDAKAK